MFISNMSTIVTDILFIVSLLVALRYYAFEVKTLQQKLYGVSVTDLDVFEE